jgi:hypothetical protein
MRNPGWKPRSHRVILREGGGAPWPPPRACQPNVASASAFE